MENLEYIQNCDRCSKEQRLKFSVQDYIWNLIPKEWHKKILCIECFLELLDKNLKQKLEIKLNDIIFFEIVGKNIKGDLHFFRF